MSAGARVVSVNAARPRAVSWRSTKRTAIDKRPVEGRVGVHRLGLAVDDQANRTFHGGVDQAVYAYAAEDLALWSGLAGRDFTPGQFGENLTTEGLDITGAVIGERWRIGSVLLEVCFVRIPCAIFAEFLGERGWVKRFAAEGRSGAYLRVLDEGELGAGDEVVVEHRPGHGVTVREVFAVVMNGDRALAPKLLLAPELKDEARERAEQLIAAS